MTAKEPGIGWVTGHTRADIGGGGYFAGIDDNQAGGVLISQVRIGSTAVQC